MKSFSVPEFYRSSVIAKIKAFRKLQDPRKKDLKPAYIDFGPISFLIARHFGFCYGVENAIEIAFKALEENKGKRIYLLSQMIHNPTVNRDLSDAGVLFLQDTHGKQLISFDELKSDDVVIIPAFGSTIETAELLEQKGIEIKKYNTTCPFVERVWKRSEQIGKSQHTIIIHGKHDHEETKATFSRSALNAPVVVVKDLKEAALLSIYIKQEGTQEEFEEHFRGRFSEGFSIEKDLSRIGIINQTTMLATETEDITQFLKEVLIEKYGIDAISDHLADTKDTLCYATNENQDATYGLMKEQADLAIVVGGFNSSNTSHLVELLSDKFNTFFVSSDEDIVSKNEIHHYDLEEKKRQITFNYLPERDKIRIIMTSGASCPDALFEKVLMRLKSFFEDAVPVEIALKPFE